MTHDSNRAVNRGLPIMAKLKEACKSIHSELDSLPYFRMLMAHTLPLESFVGQLRAMAVIQAVLEEQIRTTNDSRVKEVWSDELRKLPLLQDDLRFFEPRNLPELPAATEAALAIAGAIRLRGTVEPLALLGCLYVLEGTTLGNSMHLPDIVKTFHLRDLEGCRYYNSYGEEVRAHWQDFTARVNRALQEEAGHEEVINAARDTFSDLLPLYDRLYPIEKQTASRHVTHINPEAGNHPIPRDEAEVQAAREASRRAWDAFPYYAYRYGERGKRFSDSDTCWLVTLTDLEPGELRRQINWLSRVLASRGMPSVMLETTLRILVEELAAAFPDRRAAQAKLLTAADALRTTRTSCIPDKSVRELCREFFDAVGPALAQKHHDAGLLLASAVADTMGGVDEALPSLRQFLADESRFPAVWVAAVDTMIAALENVASPPGREATDEPWGKDR